MDNGLIFYIMLDALMDTRIGTLMRMSPEYAIKATGSKEFHSRLSDDLTDIIGGDFDQQQFAKAYYERDIHTMFYSRVTRMVEYLRTVIHEQAVRKMSGDPRIGELQVVINTYPFYLEPADLSMLQRVIAAALGQPERYVIMEFREYKDMSLAWLRSLNPAVMVVYDFLEWMKSCSDMPRTVEEAKKMTGSPETICMVPGLLQTRHDYKTIMSMDRSDTPDKDPFTIVKKSMAGAFALEVLPSRYFSVQLLAIEKLNMSDLNNIQEQIITMNQIAGRKQDNKPGAIVAQFEQVGEEFYETMKGLFAGLVDGDWDEFRNGLGDMVVVIWGEESVAEFPLVDDLAKIMHKNMSKFDTDYVTATTSLQAMQDLGYKCEIRETEVNGVKYFPIITTETSFIIDEKGQRKDYNKDKFLKSINWSEEVFEVSHNLPKPDDVQLADLERAAQLAESLSSKFASLGMALRDRMKSL